MSWCAVCCSRHREGGSCPGPLLATGPERHGRRFQLRRAGRAEECGVLIAESGELWRARIVTYPNVLWSVPGGQGAIKFFGPTPEEAERLAVAFVREHADVRGLRVADVETVVRTGRVEPERDPAGSPRRAKEERHPGLHSLRFGEEKATHEARAADLSHGGLFIVTDRPLPQGRRLKMVLELEAYSVPLTGTVAWVRARAEPGRPVGMGIRLVHVPHLYTRWVDALTAS